MKAADTAVPTTHDGRSAVLRRVAVNLDHFETVRRDHRVRFVGTLAPARMRDISRALAIATGC